MSDLKSKNGIPADGNQSGRPLDFGQTKDAGGPSTPNVRKATPIRYPALPDAGEASLLEGQESGPNSPGRMPKRMSGGGT